MSKDNRVTASNMQKFRNIYQLYTPPGEKYLEDACPLSAHSSVNSTNVGELPMCPGRGWNLTYLRRNVTKGMSMETLCVV